MSIRLWRQLRAAPPANAHAPTPGANAHAPALPGPQSLSLQQLYREARAGTLTPGSLALLEPPPKGFVGRTWERMELALVQKAIGRMALEEARTSLQKSERFGGLSGGSGGESIEAPAQGTLVTDPHVRSHGSPGIRMPSGLDFETKRQMAHYCEPLACIVAKGVKDVAAYAKKARFAHGKAESAGWTIVLEDEEAKPTDEDRRQMALIADYLTNCGMVQGDGKRAVPPSSQRPADWRPSFEYFLRQIARDRLRYDWVAVRRFGSETNATRYPCMTFCAVDASRIRRTGPVAVKNEGGKPQEEPYQGERQNTRDPIVFVKQDTPLNNGRILENYTAAEMACWSQNPRTEEEAHGYGYVESEMVVNAVKGWCYSLATNVRRFEEDAVPPGMLLLFAMMSEHQLASFELRWAQNYRGIGNRFRFPILPVNPQAGTGAQWIPMGPEMRDGEYQWLSHFLGLLLHVAYGVSPAATGWEGMNPVRAPLSEASPEAKLEAGEESFTTPLLTGIADFVTTDLVWVNPQWRGRYRFKFVGSGDYDLLEDAQLCQQQLKAAIRTTAMLWAERDQTLSKEQETLFQKYPVLAEAWHYPGPFSEGVQTLMSLQQQAQQAELQAQQQQMAAQQQKEQSALQQQQQKMAQEQHRAQLKQLQWGKPGQQPAKEEAVSKAYLV